MDRPAQNNRTRGRGNVVTSDSTGRRGRGGRGGRGVAAELSEALRPCTISTASEWNPPAGASRGVQTGVVCRLPSTATGAVRRPQATTMEMACRPPASSGGRATGLRNVPPSEGVVKDDLRGTTRGKRVLTELVRSRPDNLATKLGTSGRPITVQANYFKLNKKPSWTIHTYRVDFKPEVDLINLRRKYLSAHNDKFGSYIFDGEVMFTATYISMQNKTLELYNKNDKGETIQITLKYTGNIDPTDHNILQVLNLILRRCMSGLKLKLSGRNFYDTEQKIALKEFHLEMWPGYLTSIRQHEADILLCSEITHKVLRTDTLLDMLQQLTRYEGNIQQNFKKCVVGMIVVTFYNNKTYRVDDVDFNKNPTSKFKQKDADIDFITYFKNKYNVKIRDHKQPLLVSRPTEKNVRGGNSELILLVPELCNATGLTDDMRRNMRLMRGLSEHTRLVPGKRIERLRGLQHRIHNTEESRKVLTGWNMELDKHLVELPARVLPSQKITFGNNRQYTCDANADWTRELRCGPMYIQVDLKNWHVIYPQRFDELVRAFVRTMITVATSMKMKILEPKYIKMSDDRTSSYSSAIDNAASQDPRMLMAVLSNNNEEKYKCIKKKCCVERPIASQVLCSRTITPRGERGGGLMSVATKVVVQLNTKLSGCPWSVEIPLSRLMIVGYDVCHSGNKSYGAIIATMNLNEKQRYFSSVMTNVRGQDLSNEIAMNMSFALKQYRQTHGYLPTRILFYRDGVGEGQLYHVYHTEVQLVKNKLDEIYENAGLEKCMFTFIVVSKKINTRIFQQNANPPPGTVVDEVITLPERYDFYLVSQSVRQGTVSPTSYNILYDGMKLGADRYQVLTYRLTHLYYNYSGTLRVPAVCQYAHKLAFLVAEAIGQTPSNALQNELYFL